MDLKELLGEDLYNQVIAKVGDAKIAVVSDGNWIPKSKFDEINEQKKAYKQQVDELSASLEDMKKSAAGNEELSKKLEDMTKQLAAKDAEMRNIIMSNAIEKALVRAQAKFPDLLMSKFDMEKIEIAEDGTIKGIDDQLKSLQEKYKDLFGETQITGGEPGKGGNPKPSGRMYTREEIEKMTPAEINKNWDYIVKSLQG